MILKRERELDIMAEAGTINREALAAVEAELRPGVSTAVLNAVAEDAILSRGGKPAFKGYRGFPATLCTSVNEVVVHGIPNDRPLQDGDIVSIDIGTFFRGYAADMARTYAVGSVPDEVQRLLDATENSLFAGIEGQGVRRARHRP
jgi:methionyl aminopeptidase